ncbi:MAG: hypothetical protein DSY40_03575 [Nautilia sp.]|nr:MAG: hypothetical protein DSY40_03575 [Nautilia sp.]
MNHFKSSIIIAVIGLGIAFLLGGITALYITSLLAILEISLSFDNAVVNAKILDTMEPKWQERFITFGLPIAIFGMRFLFPLIIVAIAGNIGIIETFNLALNEPHKYQEILEKTITLIYAFGGAFLLMVFLDFLFDIDRQEKWFNLLEGNSIITKASEIDSIEMIIGSAIGIYLTYLTNDYKIAIAYFSGILLHSIIASIDTLLNTNGVRSGIMGLIYLEILDASFSFDGVIGAFALSTNIFIIMIGLGIGAMFVRSLTLYLVEKKTLTEYRYLEHGAHYAIIALAIIMLIEIFYKVNEIITGSIGIGFIAAAFIHSIIKNKQELKK